MSAQGTVVVGVDGSAESRVALRFALRDAARRKAGVRVVAAYEPPEYWATAYGLRSLPSPAEMVAENEAVARGAVEAVVADDPTLAPTGDGLAAVPVEIVAVPGPPAKALIEQSSGAALLVLGHRGRGGFASAVLGSVGLHCVLHATCPVTIVRPTTEPATAPRIEDSAAAFAPTY